MKREENNLDQLFRDGLRDYESPLSTNLWDKLDAVREEDKKPKGIVWWKWGLSASLVILLSAAVLYLFTSQEKASTVPSLNKEVELPTTSVPQGERLEQTMNRVDNSEQILNNRTLTETTEAKIKEDEPLENRVASTKKSVRQYSATTPKNSLRKADVSSDQARSELLPTGTSTIEINKNTSSSSTTTKTSSQALETKSNNSQPIALNTEAESLGKVQSTQRLNFLKTRAATLLTEAPDLKDAFTAPPIKIPFSWGPKGCYSFAGGRIKYDYYVDAFVAPEYVIRNLKARTAEDENYRQRRDDTEATLYGISGGVRLSLVTRRGLALRTGIVYNRILERFNLEKEGDERIVFEIPAGTNDTIITIETGTTILRSYNRYHSIDIPLLLGYEIEVGNFNFSINSGVYFNIFARQKGKILSQSDMPEFITSNNPQRINAFEKDLGISIYGSIGLNYQIRPNLQLLIEPNLRYQLKPITLETYPLEQQYINVGLLLGVRRQF